MCGSADIDYSYEKSDRATGFKGGISVDFSKPTLLLRYQRPDRECQHIDDEVYVDLDSSLFGAQLTAIHFLNTCLEAKKKTQHSHRASRAVARRPKEK